MAHVHRGLVFQKLHRICGAQGDSVHGRLELLLELIPDLDQLTVAGLPGLCQLALSILQMGRRSCLHLQKCPLVLFVGFLKIVKFDLHGLHCRDTVRGDGLHGGVHGLLGGLHGPPIGAAQALVKLLATSLKALDDLSQSVVDCVTFPSAQLLGQDLGLADAPGELGVLLLQLGLNLLHLGGRTNELSRQHLNLVRHRPIHGLRQLPQPPPMRLLRLQGLRPQLGQQHLLGSDLLQGGIGLRSRTGGISAQGAQAGLELG
mmetsp:Transcript_84750/g.193267  ORF Transcript_84750/g.193267 Transcript_84750/m.193267 type:complete len:260 (-) Transcript_84750:150-929(-)